MPLDTIGFGDEQQLLADSVTRFVQDRCTLERQRDWWAGKGADAAWREITERGWTGVGIPEAAGGVGGSCLDEVIIAAGIGNGLLPVAYTTIAVMATALLQKSDRSGDALASIANGSLRITVADAEDDVALNGRPNTVIKPDGGGYRIQGRKVLVLGAGEADAMLVTTVNPAKDEIVIARVACNAAGVDRAEATLLDGRQASTITLDARVEADAIVASGESAAQSLAEARARAALATAAEAVGAMHGAIDLARTHLATRKQFGKPLSDFQVVRHAFAAIIAELEMVESAVIAAATTQDAVAFQRMTSVAKAKSSKAGQLIGETVVQMHGGIGMTAEYAAGQFYKRLLVLQTLNGSRIDHLDRLAFHDD